MSRGFEKISFEQFKKDVKDDENLYQEYKLPKRSSMGFKYNVRMCNQIGIIDSDYYNNSTNEGHMFVALQNEGNKDFVVEKGEAYAQGIFTKYLTTDQEEDIELRIGGLGSTNKRSDDNE